MTRESTGSIYRFIPYTFTVSDWRKLPTALMGAEAAGKNLPVTVCLTRGGASITVCSDWHPVRTTKVNGINACFIHYLFVFFIISPSAGNSGLINSYGSAGKARRTSDRSWRFAKSASSRATRTSSAATTALERSIASLQ
jgi:hypothetical protein